MQISDISITETIDSIVDEFRRFSSSDYAITDEFTVTDFSLYYFYFESLGKLRGIQRLLSSVKYSRMIDEKVQHLSQLRDFAENRFKTAKEALAVEREAFSNSGDSARLSASAPELAQAGQGGNNA